MLCDDRLSFRTVLLFQELYASTDANDVRNIPLTAYTEEDGKTGLLTVGSILHTMAHDPLHTFFKGYGYDLCMYAVDETGKPSLPRCLEGNFYSWGYAERIQSAGACQTKGVREGRGEGGEGGA